ncbi:O-antigen ligase family protein [Marichromatium bheemlicum]|uniref:O-antigen ligase-related domain-containing protein n=1 Tax=Marichromatium bheemlicum TaxID=365339 RepID=A0ABX1IC16_9GAMM|nr:O-antigen ligase family protein [Marichromatium bheemlicum]NKN34564.1 hypothetical protein [Marichromatium bheemlicum]
MPFASVGVVWTQLYGVLIGVALIVFVVGRWQARRPLPAVPRLLWLAGGLVAGVACWGAVQAVPGLWPGAQHPLWAETAALLALPGLSGALSLDPAQSLLVAGRYLTYLGFGLLVVWHGRHRRHALLLLKLFVAVQGLYALYGLVIYYSGLETILWFDKTSYREVLTSTFVNRNSYATYAGLGVLAALALMLRYLRLSLDESRSRQTRLRELIEALTSKGWLLPVILLLCFLAVLLSESRMGLTALLAGLLVLLGSWAARLDAGRARRLGGWLLLLVLGGLGLNLLLSGDLTGERILRGLEQEDARFLVYPLVWEAIAERPWSGYGLGSFASAFTLVRDADVQMVFVRGHSDYLELIMDVGWPAALAMFAAFALLLVRAWQVSRRRHEYELALLGVAATVQVAVHATVDFSLQMPAVVYAYLLLALLGAGWARDHEVEGVRA